MRLRIAELAERTGVSVRNIRYYHQIGVLPRPDVEGRVGWYGEEHVQRLGFVRRLQERGYSLAAIADMVAAQVPAGLDDAAGLVVTRGELEALVPALAGREDLVDVEMVRLGLLRPAADGERYEVVQPALLRAGVALVARGVPVPEALTQLDRLRAELGAVAERFALILERDLLPARAGQGGTHTGQGRTPAETTRDLLDEVLPAVLVATGSVLRQALHAAVARRLAPDAVPPGGGADHGGANGA